MILMSRNDDKLFISISELNFIKFFFFWRLRLFEFPFNLIDILENQKSAMTYLL